MIGKISAFFSWAAFVNWANTMPFALFNALRITIPLANGPEQPAPTAGYAADIKPTLWLVCIRQRYPRRSGLQLRKIDQLVLTAEQRPNQPTVLAEALFSDT
jgi:hypothetical protein